MIEDHIVCPYQKTEGFSFLVCMKCRKFELRIGEKQTSRNCRAQKTKAHKLGFESALLLNQLGYPFKVVVDAERVQ